VTPAVSIRRDAIGPRRAGGRRRVAAQLFRGATILAAAVLAVAFVTPASLAQQEYSRPVTSAPQPASIGADYQLPPVQREAARAEWLYVLDVVLLTVALVAAALVVHRWRRRWMVVALTIFSLAYFGFYRQGCVCPIGATQNVAASLADPTLVVPAAVLAFFLLPLVAALVAGRVFCSGVCPLGAIQDVVLVRPWQAPRAVDRWGGLVRYLYLAAAVWFAVQPPLARDFIICRFDPFVGFFRLTGAASMLTLGAALLLVGTVVGRPYCRFLCPYGGLLALVSRYAWKPVRITPDEELDCGLCVEACPFGAIHNMRADRAECLACARCFAHCPRQQLAWGQIELYQVEALRTPQVPADQAGELAK
jgi:NosR/NirI family nitrous oxide reductase transcriptional regulator